MYVTYIIKKAIHIWDNNGMKMLLIIFICNYHLVKWWPVINITFLELFLWTEHKWFPNAYKFRLLFACGLFLTDLATVNDFIRVGLGLCVPSWYICTVGMVRDMILFIAVDKISIWLEKNLQSLFAISTGNQGISDYIWTCFYLIFNE